MARSQRSDTAARPPVLGVGFLLSQLGVHSAMLYAERIRPLGLTPPQVGVLVAIGEHPDRSQQAVADQFGIPPSRMVAFVDELEARGLVTRGRDERDRRVYRLRLSAEGESILAQLATVSRAAEADLLGPLTSAERAELADLLARLADAQGLRRGVHPGYQRLRNESDSTPCAAPRD
jgi:DNA-binding MarR family transcriptional regulator